MGWVKRTEIRRYSRWGAFNELIERNNDRAATMPKKLATQVDPSRPKRRVGDYYASGWTKKDRSDAHEALQNEFNRSTHQEKRRVGRIGHLHSTHKRLF